MSLVKLAVWQLTLDIQTLPCQESIWSILDVYRVITTWTSKNLHAETHIFCSSKRRCSIHQLQHLPSSRSQNSSSNRALKKNRFRSKPPRLLDIWRLKRLVFNGKGPKTKWQSRSSFIPSIFQEDYYCWWKKSCTSWYVQYPIIYRVLYISGGDRRISKPSTVWTLRFMVFYVALLPCIIPFDLRSWCWKDCILQQWDTGYVFCS